MAWTEQWPGRFLARPYLDFIRGFESSLDHGLKGLGMTMAGLLVGWWIYVPIHELLHAWACLLFGGTVETLEIAPLYGGAIFERFIPFVVAGGDYAGRLSGFDTGGCDGVYLATVFGPYILTLFPGVWAMIAFGRLAARHIGGAFGLGAVLSMAFAPFISLTGDAYEIGSILVTRLSTWSASRDLLRGDDLTLVARSVAEAGGATVLWVGLVLGTLVGALWALVTYHAGGWLADRLLPRQLD